MTHSNIYSCRNCDDHSIGGANMTALYWFFLAIGLLLLIGGIVIYKAEIKD